LVGVVGSGDVALTVIELSALAGAGVRFVAGDDAKVKGAWRALEESLRRQVATGRLDEATEKAALDRVSGSPELDRLSDCDLVIEAVAEDASVKRSLFATLDDAAKPAAILATTSSTASVIELAMATDRPSSVVGFHLPELDSPGRIVEIVATAVSDPATVERATAIAALLGFQAVRCRDRAGYIVDALRFPYLNDAARMLGSGYADAESIDAAMCVGCGYPAGPIADLDRLGLDRAVSTLRTLYAETRETAHAPAPILEEHLTASRPLR
jgi:3-hydroxybutyryl-CoA dehydrogenase